MQAFRASRAAAYKQQRQQQSGCLALKAKNAQLHCMAAPDKTPHSLSACALQEHDWTGQGQQCGWCGA